MLADPASACLLSALSDMAAVGPWPSLLVGQPFPIAVSGDDELLTDARRCPESIVECVDEAPTLSDVKTFGSDVARCAKKLRLRYPVLPQSVFCEAQQGRRHAGAPSAYANVEFDDFDPHQGNETNQVVA